MRCSFGDLVSLMTLDLILKVQPRSNNPAVHGWDLNYAGGEGRLWCHFVTPAKFNFKFVGQEYVPSYM
jgi:hypothetical protein